MASRLLNRRILREQANQGAQPEAVASDPPMAVVKLKRAAKTKVPAVPKIRKPRAKKAPPRFCARWGLFDNAMKQVAVFDYDQRAAADEKLADLLVKKKGSHFLQIVKELMPEPAAAVALAAGH